jgi:hypothetical protein
MYLEVGARLVFTMIFVFISTIFLALGGLFSRIAMKISGSDGVLDPTSPLGIVKRHFDDEMKEE